MQASVEQQKLLLQIQEKHTLVTKLQSEMASLPEKAELQRVEQARLELKKKAVKAATLYGDAQLAIKKIDEELEHVRERLSRQKVRLEETNQYDPKQIHSLEKEIEHMHGRITELEGQQFTQMEQLEKLQAIKLKIQARQAEYDTSLVTLAQNRDQKLSQLKAQLKAVNEQLEQLRGQEDPQLLALFDEVRENSGGIGAVKLVGLQVEGGLDLMFSAMEAQRIRSASPTQVLQSEEYEYILVRC